MPARDRVARLLDAYRQRTGRAPGGVWAAPGRINLIGEHLDYNGGHVLPCAIDRMATIAAGRRPDPILRCWSVQAGGPVTIGTADTRHATGWSAYVAGLWWALGELGMEIPGADVVVDSDVPAGAGLSSSAAVSVAAGLAAANLAGVDIQPAALAAAAQRGENEVAGAPVGRMDQMAAACSRAGHALWLDCRTFSFEAVPLPLQSAGFELLGATTATRHDLADGGFADRRSACEEAAQLLGVPFLTDLTEAQVENTEIGPVLRRRVRHVVTEEARARRTVALLRTGDLAAVGPLLLASQRSLRDDFEVSTPELDALVDAAVGAGAAGARLTGAGFGGTVIALGPGQYVASVVDAWSRLVDPNAVTEFRPAEGARRLA
jgi:galactokinase